MSAEHDGVEQDTTDDGWHDPHDIIPDAFRERYNEADTVSEALAMAEQAASDTDPDEFKRCPHCLSTRIRGKPGSQNMPHKRDEGHKCITCETHFDDALPGLVDARRKAAHAPETDRETERPRCPACLSTDLYPKPAPAPAPETTWACLDCGEHFDDALPSYNATIRGEATPAEREQIGELLRGVRER